MEADALRVFLDTHAAVAIAEGRPRLLGREARRLVQIREVCVSPIALLEVAYLHEAGKIRLTSSEVTRILVNESNVSVVPDDVRAVVERAVSLRWTRDPFDRLIVATAVLHDAKLVTKDALIHTHFDGAVW